MNDYDTILVSATYMWHLLRKMNITKVRNNFFLLLDQAGITHQKESAEILIEVILAMQQAYHINMPRNQTEPQKRFLEIIGYEMPFLKVFWSENISKLSIKFSGRIPYSQLDSVRWDEVQILLKKISESQAVFVPLIEGLVSATGEAEVRGVPFPESKVAVPNSMIPTWKRYPFFEALAPLDTPWRI